MKRVYILFLLSACLSGLITACGSGGGENSISTQLSLNIDMTPLPAATLNMPYNQTVAMSALGGTSPYLYSCAVSSGAGLSASVSSADLTSGGVLCLISGTPLTGSLITVNFSVTDSANASASAGPLSINISPSADPLDNWHLRNPLPQGDSFSGVTYGNGTFVVVSYSGTILTSPDGVAWTSINPGIYSSLMGVTYGNSIFVAVGYNGSGGTVLTSPDGVTWTSKNIGDANDYLNGVTYGNGTFVAVSGSGTILTSPDGVTWTSRNPGSAAKLNGVTYGNGTFVAVGGSLNDFLGFASGVLVTSPDGVTWTSRNPGSTYAGFRVAELYGVTYGNGTFVAVGGSSGAHGMLSADLLTSSDGVTWTSRSPGTFYHPLFGVTYGTGTFVVVGSTGTILTSPDGVTWTSRDPGITANLSGVTYGNGTFLAVGGLGTIIQSDPVK